MSCRDDVDCCTFHSLVLFAVCLTVLHWSNSTVWGRSSRMSTYLQQLCMLTHCSTNDKAKHTLHVGQEKEEEED